MRENIGGRIDLIDAYILHFPALLLCGYDGHRATYPMKN